MVFIGASWSNLRFLALRIVTVVMLKTETEIMPNNLFLMVSNKVIIAVDGGIFSPDYWGMGRSARRGRRSEFGTERGRGGRLFASLAGLLLFLR
jgi:hypothetical protein